MPFTKCTVNIAVSLGFEMRGENLVMIKPSAAEVSVFHDLAMTMPVCSCPIGETTLEIAGNPFLSGSFYLKASADATSVTFNWW